MGGKLAWRGMRCLSVFEANEKSVRSILYILIIRSSHLEMCNASVNLRIQDAIHHSS